MNDIDLIVSSVTAPLYVGVNETIPVSWTVINQGTVSALGDWFDSVYISEDEFLDNNDRLLSSPFQGQNTPLVAGGSYTVTQNINFDYFLETGDVYDGLRLRYLLFVTDDVDYTYNNINRQVEINETNNVFAQAIILTGPDLVVTAANAPTTASLSEKISVSWTVTNLGVGSAFADWEDGIYISADQFLDDSDITIATRDTKENTPLASAGSYTITQDITIPYYAETGDVYLLFVADKVFNISNYQTETNETNNVFAQAITLTAPDLVVTAATAPTTAALGETISVSWTVTNIGTVSAFANWYDTVYFSADEFFDDSDVLISDSYPGQDIPLAAGESYTVNRDIFLGAFVAPGDRYLLFVADGGYYGYNYPQGETDETNNVLAKAITINSSGYVDLVVTAVNAPTTAALGETIYLSWTVTNQGTVSTSTTLYDAVYISDDQFLDNSDIQIASPYPGQNPPLAAGGSYTLTQDISLYSGTGDVYLLFVADGGGNGNRQGEINEANNVFAQAITVTAPDLVVTAINAPIIASLNEAISVSWTVTNVGTVAASSDWYDSVYISNDQFLDQSDRSLASRFQGENTPLAAGGSYTATQDIYFDYFLGIGDRYLLFVADRQYSDNFQGETDETNNVFAQAITLTAPDLVVTAATAPTTAALGETISVSWTVTNIGTVSAFANWYDFVYISDDQFLDESDTEITYAQRGENTPLAPLQSYTITQNIALNSTTSGDVYDDLGLRYLLFITNNSNNPGETNKTNNVFAQAITLSAPDLPDLVFTAANAPNTAVVGETISVSWTVTNQGTVSASSDWYDNVYISDDQFFDNSDTQIAFRWARENTPIAAGGSYTATQDIFLGSNLPIGDFYLLFIADTSNQLPETNETNNVFAQAITLTAPDLVVSAANAPTTTTVGETISVSWTVTNQGTVSAFADWDDGVYISDDQFLDDNDIQLISRQTGENTPLVANGSYTVTQDIDIRNYIGTGDVYLIFTTDRTPYENTNNQRETDETNNVLAQAITINPAEDVDLIVSAAQIPITAALGEKISVSLTVTNQGTDSVFTDWYDFVYISDDQFFDDGDISISGWRENTRLGSGDSYTTTADIYIPSQYTNNSDGSNVILIGDRYLLFVTDGSKSQSETNENNNVFAQAITLTAPDLIVTAANAPNTATLGEAISVSWTVTNQGTVPAFADWYDSVYFSADQFFNYYEDTQLASSEIRENTPLASGDSYTVTQSITPYGFGGTGDYYLLFVTDHDGFQNQNNQGETNETNNVRAVAISLYAQDQIFNGTSGRDTLTGNYSNNLITGLQGADTLTGGAGSDRFVYTSIRDAGDTITDFVAGTDKIDFSQLLQSLSPDSLDYDTATTQGYLSFGTQGTNTTVLIDLDGTAGRARPTPLLTVQDVSQSTLTQRDNFVF
ncbi:CARDB domain-containing protein [Nostoc sp. WHI]|uniref:CARDB domain-containing protein n=1 Tax=Nostoc sp. WHI TaxID=2650611 RepID=UPI0018C51EAA|nr:CARDB domain-containing protein [Nostoc sp. WHI]MBG1265632.1 type I secretion C-terminal target domain-containing protein [Nostoc sp. WHI]